MGLLSDGGVHSSREHLYALLEMARERGAARVYVHASSTAATSRPRAASATSRTLERFMGTLGAGEIATVMGRYYAMDRDNRWDRVERAWRAMVLGEGRLGRECGRGGTDVVRRRGHRRVRAFRRSLRPRASATATR